MLSVALIPLAVVILLSVPMPSRSEEPVVFSVRTLLDEKWGAPTPDHSEVEDALIDTSGIITQAVVLPHATDEMAAKPRLVAWSDIDVLPEKRDVVVKLDRARLEQRPIFDGPVAGTLGGPRSVLVSKLLAAAVQDGVGGNLGTVSDVICKTSGVVQTVVIQTADGAKQTPWAQVSVRRGRPNLAVPGGEADAVVVWNR